MTDSETAMQTAKRERLVASAVELLHRRGAERPTLAEIAAAAGVPPGNVYYYFKTRDELVGAVVEQRAAEIRDRLASLDRRSTPRSKLRALTRSWADAAELVAAHGCPIGALNMDLSRRGSDLHEPAAELFRIILEWAATQFREMGRGDAPELATALLSGVQGASVLANALDDPKLLAREIRRLERWIDSLA